MKNSFPVGDRIAGLPTSILVHQVPKSVVPLVAKRILVEVENPGPIPGKLICVVKQIQLTLGMIYPWPRVLNSIFSRL